MMTRQGFRQSGLIGRHQHRPYSIKGIQTHPGRAPAGEKTEHHFLPQMPVGAMLTDMLKLIKPLAYLAAAFPMMLFDVFDRDGLGTSLHCGYVILDAGVLAGQWLCWTRRLRPRVITTIGSHTRTGRPRSVQLRLPAAPYGWGRLVGHASDGFRPQEF